MDDNLPVPTLTGKSRIHYRHFGGAADFAAIVAVREACREHDQVDVHSAREGIPSVASLEHAYSAVPAGSPDWVFAETEGQVVGYAQVTWWTETGPLEVYLHLGWVMPVWRGRGIGRAFVAWAEERGRVLHGQRAPGHAATFAANCSSTQSDARRLMQRAGYRLIHGVSDMVCADLDSLHPIRDLPSGLTIKPVEIENMRYVYNAYKDAWRGLWSETPETEADFLTFLGNNVRSSLFDPSLWQVAWDGDEVAGFVIAVMDSGVGKFPEVGVCKRWQRSGVGTALMSRAMHLLHERGASQLRLYTNAENPVGAKTLYEHLGFREVKQHGFYRKAL